MQKLELTHTNPLRVTFSNPNDDVTEITVKRDKWEELGKPSSLTVSPDGWTWDEG